MRILHVTDCSTGGVPAVISDILKRIPGKALFIGDVPNDIGQSDAILAPLKIKRSFNPLFVLLSLIGIGRAVLSVRPSIVHGHSSFGGFLGGLVAFIFHVPFVYTPHASPNMRPKESISEILLAGLERVSLVLSKHIVACSHDESKVLSRYGVGDKLRVISNGVEAIRLDRPSETRWDILFVGRIASQKRPDLFVAFAERIKELDPSARIGWIGPGEPIVSTAVEWIGSLSEGEVVDQLLQSKIYFSLSDYEGLSLATLRAACCGCFLVLRDTMGNRSPVVEGAVGLIFGDSCDIPEIILKLLKDKGLWTNEEYLRRRSVAEAAFSLEKMANQLGGLYREL